MPGVGFEPTQLSLADLKSAPLDHSGIPASLHTGFEPVTLRLTAARSDQLS